MRVLTVGKRWDAGDEGAEQRAWRAIVVALRERGDTVTVLTTEDAPVSRDACVLRELRWFWDGERDAWRRPPRLEASRIVRHGLRTLGDTVRTVRPDVVLWAAMGGLPLTLVGASGLPEVALDLDGWPDYGPRVDPATRRDGWDPGAVGAWCCATDALAATVRTLDGVTAQRITAGVDGPAVLHRLDGVVGLRRPADHHDVEKPSS